MRLHKGRLMDFAWAAFFCLKKIKLMFSNSPLHSQEEMYCLRESSPDYGQLILDSFDPETAQKTLTRRRHKIEETLVKLRSLHDELNQQLYAHPTERPVVHSPADVFEVLRCFIGNLDHEELWVVSLDTRNRVMRLVALYKGSVNSSQVRVAEVFRQAIIDNSPAIILAHNHPSGDPSPSPEDISLSRALAF